MSFLKIKLLSLLTETTSQETETRGANTTIRTPLAFINDQGLPPRDLLKDRSKIPRVRDGLVGGDENVILQFCKPGFRFIMHQLIPPHNLATLGLAVVGNHS